MDKTAKKPNKTIGLLVKITALVIAMFALIAYSGRMPETGSYFTYSITGSVTADDH